MSVKKAKRKEYSRRRSIRAAATRNARLPSVDRRRGSTGQPELALRQTEDDDKKKTRLSEFSCRVSARYGGAVPCGQRCVGSRNTQRRNLILSGTFNPVKVKEKRSRVF